MKYTIPKQKIRQAFLATGTHHLQDVLVVDDKTLIQDEVRNKYTSGLIFDTEEYVILKKRTLRNPGEPIYTPFITVNCDSVLVKGHNKELEILYKELLPECLDIDAISNTTGYDEEASAYYYMEKILKGIFRIHDDTLDFNSHLVLYKDHAFVEAQRRLRDSLIKFGRIILDMSTNYQLYQHFEDITIDIRKEHMKDSPELRKLLLEELNGGN